MLSPEAQALYQIKIAEIRASERNPSLYDRAVAWNDAEATVAAQVAKPVLASANDNAESAMAEAKPAPNSVPGLVTKPGRQTRKLKRRSGLRQRENARRMRAHDGTTEPELVKHLHPSSPTPSTPTKKAKPKASTTITTGPTYRRMIASWEDAGELPRIIAINRALPELGVPFAFSLNFDPKIIKAANDNKRGFLDHVRRKVALTLKRELGRTPPMWIVVETDDDGRPHIHGGLALNDNDRPNAIEKALAKAGGNWTRKGSAPADVRVQWNADGWAVYPLKRFGRTRQHLRQAAGLAPGARVSLYSVSDDLLSAGKRIHDEVRRAIGRG